MGLAGSKSLAHVLDKVRPFEAIDNIIYPSEHLVSLQHVVLRFTALLVNILSHLKNIWYMDMALSPGINKT